MAQAGRVLFGTGLGVQIPVAVCIITSGYWMFVLVNYHLVETADDRFGNKRGAHAGVLVDRGEAGGLLDLGTCPSVAAAPPGGPGAPR